MKNMKDSRKELESFLIFGILKNIDHSLEKIIFSKFVM